MWFSSRLPASGVWCVVSATGGVLMLENMDLLKDAAGGGCGMFDVGVRVRAGDYVDSQSRS